MRRIFAFIITFFISLSFISCSNNAEQREISCEDIINAYQDAGYIVKYHNHRGENTEYDAICNIQIEDSNNPEKNYLYIDRYANADEAENAAKENKYNIVTWFIFALHGEWRWLKSESYGEFHYHTFNNKIVKPLEDLM